MIDRAGRQRLGELLRHLAAAQITNEEFERRVPRHSADPAVEAIRQSAWFLYDDLHEHRLVDRHRLTKDGRRAVARWIVFLNTDLEYEWPRPHPLIHLFGMLANVITLGGVGWLWRRYLGTVGDILVWPFIRQQDYDVALEHPRLLSGAV